MLAESSGARLPTGGEEHDGLEAGVLGSVHLQGLQLLHLLLEDSDVVHEGHHAFGGHGRGVQASRGQQGRHMQGHGALGSIQHKQLTPRHAQQRHLATGSTLVILLTFTHISQTLVLAEKHSIIVLN